MPKGVAIYPSCPRFFTSSSRNGSSPRLFLSLCVSLLTAQRVQSSGHSPPLPLCLYWFLLLWSIALTDSPSCSLAVTCGHAALPSCPPPASRELLLRGETGGAGPCRLLLGLGEPWMGTDLHSPSNPLAFGQPSDCRPQASSKEQQALCQSFSLRKQHKKAVLESGICAQISLQTV